MASSEQTLATRILRPDTLWAAFLLAAVWALFHFAGHSPIEHFPGQSVFRWIFFQWTSSEGDFSHGWLMPLIAGYVLWERRAEIRNAPLRITWAAILPVAGALLLHVAAYRVQQPRISLIAMVLLLWFCALFLYGWLAARHALFPLAYMLLAFMSYWMITFTFPLRLMACAAAGGILNGLGIETVRQGTLLYSSAGGGFNFNVADPCSGLRSLVVMTALAAPFAYFTQKTLFKKWLLFLLSIPLAAVANIIRLVSIALVAEFAGQELATKLFHDFSGYFVFFIATILLVGASRLVADPPRRRRPS